MKLAWSNLAKRELRALRTFSTDRWGQQVALGYVEDVRSAAERVAADPVQARMLTTDLRIVRVRSHYLIVHIDEAADRLTIARILHTSMDVGRHLP